MTAASGTAVKGDQPLEPGAARTQQHATQPRQPLSPASPDHRLPAARVKNALRATATPARPTARILTRPPARTNRQPSGKAQPARQPPHARKSRTASETPGHFRLTRPASSGMTCDTLGGLERVRLAGLLVCGLW